MTFRYPTPILGIVNEQDRACAEMLAVVIGAPEKLLWTYLRVREKAKWTPLVNPSEFTPLSRFFCEVWFTPSGQLTVTKLAIHVTGTRYSSGEPRAWQGENNEKITIHPDVVRYVHEVLAVEAQAKSEARRVKV